MLLISYMFPTSTFGPTAHNTLESDIDLADPSGSQTAVTLQTGGHGCQQVRWVHALQCLCFFEVKQRLLSCLDRTGCPCWLPSLPGDSWVRV